MTRRRRPILINYRCLTRLILVLVIICLVNIQRMAGRISHPTTEHPFGVVPKEMEEPVSGLAIVYSNSDGTAVDNNFFKSEELKTLGLQVWKLDSNRQDCGDGDVIVFSNGDHSASVSSLVNDSHELVLHVLDSTTTVQTFAKEASWLVRTFQATASSNSSVPKHLIVSPSSSSVVRSMRHLLATGVQHAIGIQSMQVVHILSDTSMEATTRLVANEVRQFARSSNSIPYQVKTIDDKREAVAVQSQQTTRPGKKKICFVSSVFGHDSKQVDEIPSIELAPASVWKKQDLFAFYAFTNLADLQAPGWNKIVLESADYPNHVVASRFPKFMAWTYAPSAAVNNGTTLQDSCRAIFYADGGWLPAQEASVWFHMAESLRHSETGLMQYSHGRSKGIAEELDNILRYKKDTAQHVDLERQWLEAQGDYQPNSTNMHCNQAFGYDPDNAQYQQLSSSFWNQYSQGLTTFRDQPAWNYWLQHYNITPLYLGLWPDDMQKLTKRKGGKKPRVSGCCWLHHGKTGFGAHTYVGKK